MLLYLVLLFTVLPVVELYLLIQLGTYTSSLFAIGVVVLTGVIGANLARWQGLQAYARVQKEMASGQMPGDSLVDGLMIFAAGIVLITPGILTDLLGFCLLIPPIRKILKAGLLVFLKKNAKVHFQQATKMNGNWTTQSWSSDPADSEPVVHSSSQNAEVIDVEYRKIDD